MKFFIFTLITLLIGYYFGLKDNEFNKLQARASVGVPEHSEDITTYCVLIQKEK